MSTESKSLNRQEILEEDEYTAALSHIIARDFFPSLVHIDATNSYLDALRSNDPNLIHASVRRLQELDATPAYPTRRDLRAAFETPYSVGPSETPFRTPRESGEPTAKRPRYNTDMNLDSFQAKYTSEDNASFTQIMHEENRQRRERWGWAWEAQTKVEEQQAKMLEGRARMLIEQPSGPGVRERFVIEAPMVAGSITAAGEPPERSTTVTRGEDDSKGKELAVVDKDAPESVVDVMAPKKDARPAGVDAWKFKTRNSLMFPPDADVSPYDPSSSVVSIKPDAVPKIIKHDNTRLERDTGDKTQSLSAPPSPTQSRIDAAIEGTPYRPKSPAFSLVPNVPSPTAEQMGSKAVRQLMTWGTLNATPRIISQSNDVSEEMPPPNTFQISAPSSRETLSHKLSASAAKSLRTKAGLLNGSTPLLGRTPSCTPARGSMAPPNWTPRRADAPGNLTPAAKRLLDRTTLGTAAARRAEAMGKASGWGGSGNSKEKDLSHMRWTPTPITRKR